MSTRSRSSDRRSRFTRAGAISLSLVLVATACGDDDNTSPATSVGGGGGTTTPGSGGGPTTAAADAVEGGTFRWGFHVGPDTDDFTNIQPNFKCTNACVTMFHTMFDPLVEIDPETREAVGVLAERWEVNSAKDEWKFFLKKEAKFHDGTPVTAEDVRFSLDRACNAEELKPGSGNGCSKLSNLESMEVIDDTTILIKLKDSQPDFLVDALSHTQNTGIVPKAAVLKAGQVQFGENPIGSGPYKFVEWVKGDHVTVERNPDYTWGPKYTKTAGRAPFIEKIIFTFIPDAQTRVNALLTGQVDGIDQVPPPDQAAMEGDSKWTITSAPYGGLNGMFYVNTQRGPLMDLNVRKAVSAAVNREDMDKVLFNGVATPVETFVSEGYPYEDSSAKVPGFNLAESKKYLEAAGYTIGSDGWATKGGQRLKLVGIAPASSAKIYELLQAQLKQAGIELEVQIKSIAEGRADMDAGRHDIWNSAAIGFGNPGLQPLYSVFHSSRVPPNGFNPSFFDVPEFDKLIDEARTATDEAVAAKKYSEVQHFLADNVAAIPFLRVDRVFVLSSKFAGVEPDASGAYRRMWDVRQLK